jgi:dynein light chain LC8-type
VVVATAAVDKHKQLKDVAQFIKHEMDHKFSASKATEGVYHCVVGKSFASESHAWLCQLLAPQSGPVT